jgi:CDP-diacylglycerol---glycerol-3-phosphate 3-phosphatidyltransferase
MRLTVPTMLTLARIVMIPVLVLVFYLPFKWTNFASAAVFILASVTDWLDGWIARRYHQYSAFGAFLDPVADKLMVATALFLIVQGHPTAWMAFWAAVIVGREIAVSALREWMAELGQRARVQVAAVGKIKTIVQMVAISMLLYAIVPAEPPQPKPWMGDVIFVVGDWLLAGAALLTLWSGYEYLRAAWPVLKAGEGHAVDLPAGDMASPDASKPVDTLGPDGKIPPLSRE